MIQKILLLLLLLIGDVSFSQTSPNDTLIILTTENGELRINKSCHPERIYTTVNLTIGASVINECESKKIYTDKVLIKFIHDSNCKIIDIIVLESGEISSFTSLVNVFCSELLEQLKNTNPFICSNSWCEDKIFPAKLFVK